MPVELALSIVVAMFMAKGDIRNCSCQRAVKLLEGGENCVGKRLCRIETVDEMQFGFMPENNN